MARNYSSIAEPKTLAADVAIDATQITLNNVTGLPSAPYVLVLNPDTASEEAVLVTVNQSGVTSPTLKVQRAIEANATAKAHTSGQAVKHMIVGTDLQIVHDHIDATGSLHGIASNEGNVVGTLKAQTLENKTLTTPKINENVTLTATSTELNKLDGATVSTAEINRLSGVTSSVVSINNTQTLTNKTIDLTNNTVTGTLAEFNTALDGADFVSLAGTETLTNKTLTSPVVTGGTLNGGVALTVDSTELNKLDGVTATTAEINKLAGLTATTAELNKLTGATPTVEEINFVDGVTSSIQTQLNTNTPVATIVMYGAAAAPTGWLLCDGAAVSRTTYATLFGVIGTDYGVGDNTTTFNLPDLKGRVPVGYGAGSGLTNRNDLGAKFGTETQTLTEANLPSHDHSIGWQSDGTNDHDHALDSGTVTRVAGPSDGGSSGTGTINSGLAGSGTAHNNLQPSTVVNFIIKH